MITYKVTTELKTPWWLKLLRFFRLKSKREEFEILFERDCFKINDILSTRHCDVKILNYGKNNT